ncbi:MAG: hypothetical protein JSR40_18430 [Proteobacteria bacterium]|nr:hypothetical protein [Pseudomonadota bacterium]
MKWRYMLGEWGLAKLQLPQGFVDAEFAPHEADREAAWELYIELATRISTQPLPPGQGVEAAALESLHSLFATTREIMKRHGRDAQAFARIGIAVLNRIVRPMLTRWHARFAETTTPDEASLMIFRQELEAMRLDMLAYARLLAAIADVAPMAGEDEHE